MSSFRSIDVRRTVRLSVFFVLCVTVPLSHAEARPPSPIHFEFRNGFWINLHHFLYLQTLAQDPQRRGPLLAQIFEASSCIPELKSAEADSWTKSVSYYRQNLVSKDWLFDEELVRENDLLSDQRSARVSAAEISPELRQALNQAAPIYRRFCWKKHRERNAAWIAAVRRKLIPYGALIATRLVGIYEQEWPSEPILIDVVTYANWAGAYTTLNPNHTTISSLASDYQGYFALEMIFHEASHLFGDRVRSAIDSECKAEKMETPRDLWHALLFYTAGEVTREELARKGIRYVPYADQFRLYEKVPHWLEYRAAFETGWKPYLDGRGNLSEAIKAVVASVAARAMPATASPRSSLQLSSPPLETVRELLSTPSSASHAACMAFREARSKSRTLAR